MVDGGTYVAAAILMATLHVPQTVPSRAIQGVLSRPFDKLKADWLELAVILKKDRAFFWNMLLTAGTRPLRLITLLGFFSVAVALCIGGYALYEKITGSVQVQGWASLVIVVSFFSGCILVSLGMIAEYLAVSMGIAMGKPLYVIGTRSSRLR
jgi:ABC-type uncharacterized transport system permease subunit